MFLSKTRIWKGLLGKVGNKYYAEKGVKSSNELYSYVMCNDVETDSKHMEVLWLY